MVLERLLGEKRDFVELHTVWLEEKHSIAVSKIKTLAQRKYYWEA